MHKTAHRYIRKWTPERPGWTRPVQNRGTLTIIVYLHDSWDASKVVFQIQSASNSFEVFAPAAR
ncbi:MAG: hypothetical protein KC587_18895, partial [Nitrospira sp.]|nr:hypothetical protein [Nitrospira sp.]